MPEHTAPPWYVASDGMSIMKHREPTIVGDIAVNSDWTIAAAYGLPTSVDDLDVTHANAEFIVTACNAHDALHRALSLIAHGRHLSADGARGILDVLGLEVVAI